jgi:D-alanyl-lipoteichoic acid acyltransferase DltB (MBOAT superfamily)
VSFTSYDFLLFFLTVFVLYWLARERRLQNALLLAASYVFYSWVHPWYTLMLGLSTLADYFIAQGMAKTPGRKRGLLWLSLLVNLGVLGFFKYYNFFSPALVDTLNSLGLHADPLLVQILLPVGLSFYTLKKLGYVLDVSNGTLKPTHSLLDFALYVSFFPQIVAGPIDRPRSLLPQLEATRIWKMEYFYQAWPLLVMGFFKKIVIANTISSIVDRVFSLNAPNSVLIIPATLGFTLQILADFSAYTDLSRASALLLGFQTPENFKNPYLSLSPTEFWNRWHITLSTWLRDYIFFPLRRALMRSQRPLPEWVVQSTPPLVTMLVSGIWHGAGWTYLAWGGMYGLLIVAYQALGLRGEWKPQGRVKVFFAWLGMFAFIVFGWLLFRSYSLTWALQALFSNPFAATLEERVVGLITLSLTLFYSAPLVVKLLMDRYLPADSFFHALYYAIATLVVIVFLNSSASDFIYFQF